jgi:hypothetical protein
MYKYCNMENKKRKELTKGIDLTQIMILNPNRLIVDESYSFQYSKSEVTIKGRSGSKQTNALLKNSIINIRKLAIGNTTL